MTLLFIGVLFLVFDFNVALAQGTLCLLPDFAGFLLVYLAARDLKKEAPAISLCASLSLIFSAYAFCSFLARLSGCVSGLFLYYLLNIADTITRLAVLFLLPGALSQLEDLHPIQLYSLRLRKQCALIISFQVFSLLLIMVPLASAACLMISFVFGILFAFSFNMARINWQDGIALGR